MTQLSINTAQNVQISFTAASVGDRLVAYIVDLLIKIGYGVAVWFVFFYLLGFSRLFITLDNGSKAAMLLLFFFPIPIYSLLLESLFEGQTFGKRLRRIKVVKIDGYQASFGDYLVRWFFRVIDISILEGIVGLVAIATTEKNQRLGDMAAGTAVITLKNNINISHTILEEIDEEYVPVYPLVIKLSDNDMRIIKETFALARSKADHQMISKLRDKVESVSGIRKESNTSDAEFIRTLLKDYNFYTQSM